MNRCRVDLKQWLVWWKGQLRQSTWAPGHFHTLEPPASSRDSLSVTHAAVITMPWDTWWSTCSFQVFCTSFDKLFGNIVSPMNQTWSRVKVHDKAQDPAFSFPLTFLKKKKTSLRDCISWKTVLVQVQCSLLCCYSLGELIFISLHLFWFWDSCPLFGGKLMLIFSSP